MGIGACGVTHGGGCVPYLIEGLIKSLIERLVEAVIAGADGNYLVVLGFMQSKAGFLLLIAPPLATIGGPIDW
ncbi:MAG: hypothetical protein KBT63_05840 [Porticoccaceae bacterium]|nr:hypothetical protein [Porticoccaceae bacterium]